MKRPPVTFVHDLAWPWSVRPFGPWLLVFVALILIGLTLWTYAGVAHAKRRRIAAIVCLRLLALCIACVMILRPSFAYRDKSANPSTLLLVFDKSLSMTIQDMFGSRSRWDVLQQLLKDSEGQLSELRDEQNISVVLHQFAEDAQDFDVNGIADGKRTDFGQMLQTLYKLHARDRNLRGLLVLSDGADNGTRFPAFTEAARWRSLPCPITTFGFGQPTTADRQRDIVFTSINPEPAPVPIKGKLTVKGFVDAPGFENALVNLRLLIDDKEVFAKKEMLRKTTRNEVTMVTDAPAVPGEVKVTLKIDSLAGETATGNNEISTYLTVTKEGISVLFVDKLRFPEPQMICDELSADPRIRLYVAWRRTDEPSPEQADLFQFDKQHYDVIILGDLSALRLSAGNPPILARIHDMVRDKGTGLLMMGGYQSFGNSDWGGTPIAKLLPVDVNESGQVDERVRIEPTPDGLAHYVMRLSDRPDENKQLWRQLPELEGITRLGVKKPGARVLATRAGSTEPVLVGQDFGNGRTLAFAGDTTWRWLRLGQPKSDLGRTLHARFWRQLVLWLAKQDQVDGSVWVKPDARRLPAGGKLGFNVGLRGKGGVDISDANFEVVVVDPLKAQSSVLTAREAAGERGTYWKTDTPGEYRVMVRGRGKDTDGKEISGEAQARFLIYQDDAELVRRAADHDFLAKLAHAGGGEFHRAQELPEVLKKLQQASLPQDSGRLEVWPDWRRSTLSGFIVGIFLLFVMVLSLEWLLRRMWGFV